MEKSNMDFKRNEEYITTDGEEHKKIEKEKKKIKYASPFLFGELVVDQKLYRKLKEDAGNIEDEEKRYAKLADLIGESKLETIRMRLAAAEPLDDFIENFAVEALENPAIGEHVPDDMKVGFADFLIRFAQDKEKIPDASLRKMLKYHVENYRKEATILECNFEAAKADFLKCLLELIEEKKFPSFIDFDKISSRVDNSEIELKENIYSSDEDVIASVQGNSITYNWEYRNDSADEIKNTLFHELVHISAGKIVQKRKFLNGTYSIRRKRSGFSVREGDRRWINEGTTEMIAKIISEQAGLKSKKDAGESYKNEQAIIEDLIKKGVPREYFIEAFFENYDEKIKGMPKWKRLVQKIHEVDGGGFLKRGKEEVEERDKEDYDKHVEAIRKSFEKLN